MNTLDESAASETFSKNSSVTFSNNNDSYCDTDSSRKLYLQLSDDSGDTFRSNCRRVHVVNVEIHNDFIVKESIINEGNKNSCKYNVEMKNKSCKCKEENDKNCECKEVNDKDCKCKEDIINKSCKCKEEINNKNCKCKEEINKSCKCKEKIKNANISEIPKFKEVKNEVKIDNRKFNVKVNKNNQGFKNGILFRNEIQEVNTLSGVDAWSEFNRDFKDVNNLVLHNGLVSNHLSCKKSSKKISMVFHRHTL